MQRHAGDLFKTAERGSGGESSFSILAGDDGAIRILPSSGWELEAMRLYYGARSAFAVTREHGAVRLQARNAAESLLLEKGEAQQLRHSWTVDHPQYLLVPTATSKFPQIDR